MAHLAGYAGRLRISDDGGSSYVNVGGVVELAVNFNQNNADVSDYDSAGWEESLPVQRSASFDVTINYDDADAGQLMLMEAWFSNTALDVEARPNNESGKYEYTCAINFETAPQISGPNADKKEMSVTMKSNGAVSRATI